MTTPKTVPKKLPKKAKKKAPAKLTKRQIEAKLKKREKATAATAAAKAEKRKLVDRDHIWTTKDELKFLADLPEHMQKSALLNGRPPTIVELYRSYSNYLTTALQRKEWGDINSVPVIEEAKVLCQRYKLMCGR
jgi:hypothetical protein